MTKTNLINNKIRSALKEQNTTKIDQATLELCENDKNKSMKIIEWFIRISINCKNKTKLNTDITMMRLWQLGHIDIIDISTEGSPLFSMSLNCKEKIDRSKNEGLRELLFTNPN